MTGPGSDISSKMHLDKWAAGIDTKGAFTSNIDEQTVCEEMCGLARHADDRNENAKPWHLNKVQTSLY